MAEPETPAVGDEIKPYKIHVGGFPSQIMTASGLELEPWLTCPCAPPQVSTKYLDLTRQKLELTRLPHEGSAPKSEDWWEPKPQVDPLIDFWYSALSYTRHATRRRLTPRKAGEVLVA